MSETLVKVENVSKKFCRNLKRSLWYGLKDLSSELSGGFTNNNEFLRKDEFWAVKNVSFELKRGECLGLIGKNGAGKTTLLRILNGLIRPDCGRIEMRGRVGALIALGAGFNPILTGRENIYINASVLGLTKDEIDEKYEEIVNFAELGEFINTPVQNYSSGMQMRLGFAVASALDPDILIIDEVLAVGDISFVLKCFHRIDKILSNASVIFVSHNMPQVDRMCNKILIMKSGEMVSLSNRVSDGINTYYSMFKHEIRDFNDNDLVKLKEIKLGCGSRYSDRSCDTPFIVDYGSDLNILLNLEFEQFINDIQINFLFYDQAQILFGAIYSSNSNFYIDASKGNCLLKVILPRISFAQGIYSITVVCKKGKNSHVLFRYQSVIYFQVIGKTHGWAPVVFNADWEQLNKLS